MVLKVGELGSETVISWEAFSAQAKLYKCCAKEAAPMDLNRRWIHTEIKSTSYKLGKHPVWLQKSSYCVSRANWTEKDSYNALCECFLTCGYIWLPDL